MIRPPDIMLRDGPHPDNSTPEMGKMVLFAAPDDDLAMGQAKEYIAENNLTNDMVKIAKVVGQLIIRVK